jgi:hypothetical protein
MKRQQRDGPRLAHARGFPSTLPVLSSKISEFGSLAMTRLFVRLALVGSLCVLAPAARAQTSISVDRTGGNMLPTTFTVELRDASGNASGKAVIDHKGMGIRAQAGYVPGQQLAALEQAVIAADLLNQAGDEWTGALPDVATQTFTDQDGNYSTLHPMGGAVPVTPEMATLSQAMSDAQLAFVAGAPPSAAVPFLSYTYEGGWIGALTLEVLSDGSCHLTGQGARFSGIDVRGQLTQAQIDSLSKYMTAHAKTWAGYPTQWGRLIPDGTHETITYTDANGNAESVTRWGAVRAGRIWTYVEKFLKGEAKALDPSVLLP